MSLGAIVVEIKLLLMVERVLSMHEVAGSIPASSKTILFRFALIFARGAALFYLLLATPHLMLLAHVCKQHVSTILYIDNNINTCMYQCNPFFGTSTRNHSRLLLVLVHTRHG